MRLGKLTNDQLNSLILSKFSHTRAEVVCSPQVGVDCAAVNLGGRLAVLSTDPITSADKHLGRLTVHVSCNDAAAAGAEPIGLLVTLLIPPSAEESEVDAVASELAQAARAANVEIIGGHTEVTDSVTRMVTCATVVARAGERGVITPQGMRPGQDIVMTKYAGLEGTAVMASDFAERFKSIGEAGLSEARRFIECVSVVREGLYAAGHGAAAMHDITEGGVFGAVWEMAFASGCGAVIDVESIPLHPLTRGLCEMANIDPYRLLSSGSMLIACENGTELAKGLEASGVKATVIGRAAENGVCTAAGEPIAPPEADELYKLFK